MEWNVSILEENAKYHFFFKGSFLDCVDYLIKHDTDSGRVSSYLATDNHGWKVVAIPSDTLS